MIPITSTSLCQKLYPELRQISNERGFTSYETTPRRNYENSCRFLYRPISGKAGVFCSSNRPSPYTVRHNRRLASDAGVQHHTFEPSHADPVRTVPLSPSSFSKRRSPSCPTSTLRYFQRLGLSSGTRLAKRPL